MTSGSSPMREALIEEIERQMRFAVDGAVVMRVETLEVWRNAILAEINRLNAQVPA